MTALEKETVTFDHDAAPIANSVFDPSDVAPRVTVAPPAVYPEPETCDPDRSEKVV
jgi:hypothetical protein